MIKNCAWWSDIGEMRLPAIQSSFITLLKMLPINVWLRLINLVGEVIRKKVSGIYDVQKFRNIFN